MVKKIISCHVQNLDSYPETMKSALFNKIASGGSYPDAESAMKIIVSEAKISGNEDALKQFIDVTGNTGRCVKKGMNELSSMKSNI